MTTIGYLQNELDKALDDIRYYKRRIERLNTQLQQKDNIIKEVKSQLDYLETYSSKEDVFEDMKRRLDKIEKIIDKENKDE
jgi:DNA repair exonuclease SbcCD ATPase subunit